MTSFPDAAGATAKHPASDPASNPRGVSNAVSTGDPAVDALIEQAAEVQALPVGEHKAHYTQILQGLEQELDTDPAAALRGGGS